MRRPSTLSIHSWALSAALLALAPALAPTVALAQQQDAPGEVQLTPRSAGDQEGAGRTLRVLPPGGSADDVTAGTEAAATETEPAPTGGEVGDGALTGENVKESLPANPTDQGMRPPDTLDEEDVPQLYDLLARVRNAPVMLNGEPMPRPNPFASEPAKEMPSQSQDDMSLFVEDYIE